LNERLKQLMLEAGYAAPELAGRAKKLSELIVQECVQVCEPTLDEPYEDMTEFGKGLVEGQDVAIERIKEHFGIEL
jgi:hypothetical protein